MATAVLTFVYNEAVNLPIWVKYYGDLFGRENLFIGDRGTDDGSTDGLGPVNLLRLPRLDFDEDAKTNFISSLHRSLLGFYDEVIITDCDELIAVDPDRFDNLRDFLAATDFEHLNCIGLDVLHILNEEPPLDLAQPILAQRRHGRFHSPCCKPLISRVPLTWLPGFHSCSRPPHFDNALFMFHTKVMDYGIAMNRQRINLDTKWSDQSLAHNYGAHHRFRLPEFVHSNFLVPVDMIRRGLAEDFRFEAETAAIVSRTEHANGHYYIPMDIAKLVVIPHRFARCL